MSWSTSPSRASSNAPWRKASSRAVSPSGTDLDGSGSVTASRLDDLVALDLDLDRRQRVLRRAVDDRTVLGRVLAAVARALDLAVGDLADRAPLVGADRTERLEGAFRRLGDDDLLVLEDHSAADRHVGRRYEGH